MADKPRTNNQPSGPRSNINPRPKPGSFSNKPTTLKGPREPPGFRQPCGPSGSPQLNQSQSKPAQQQQQQQQQSGAHTQQQGKQGRKTPSQNNSQYDPRSSHPSQKPGNKENSSEDPINLPFGFKADFEESRDGSANSGMLSSQDWQSRHEYARDSNASGPLNPSCGNTRRSQSFEELTELVKQELRVAHKLDEKLLQTHMPDNGQHRSREVSSGLGGESVSDTDMDMDNLCRNIVAKVMQRTSQPKAVGMDQCTRDAEIEQIRFDLRSERTKVHEMQNSIKLERMKSLEWMEKHNHERDSRQLLQAEMAELKQEMQALETIVEREKEERIQLKSLYEAERSQSDVLEDALQMERDHFRKLKQTLELERSRAKAASDRDAETIIDLRTSLEVERERSSIHSNAAAIPPNCSPFMSRHHNKAPMAALEESHAMQNLILKFQHEIKEERDRVDALKCCLEQERERSEMLMMAANGQNHSNSSNNHGPLGGAKRGSILGKEGSFDQDWVMFHQRRIDEAEMEKAEVFRELQKQQQINMRMHEELVQLRQQVGSMAGQPAKDHQKAYVRDLEAKMDMYRHREAGLIEEMGRVRSLIHGLQNENAILHEKEKQFWIEGKNREEQHEARDDEEQQQQQQQQQENSESNAMLQQKMERIMGENEALQNSVTLLENRIGRLKDELDLQDIPPQSSQGSSAYPHAVIMELELHLDRVEEFRQSLVWQKNFLLLLLVAQTQEQEPTTGKNKPKKIATRRLAGYFANFPRLTRKTPKIRFRIVGRAIQAQIRLQLLVRQRKEKTSGPMEDFEFRESPKPNVKPLLTTDM
ncbi:hypothetical protein TCAL_06003 [Tigriopus californicus]|uniref:Pericentrin/AKAP-450 centrosomal targeting domain-containing protein n=1 Tax=Tigriopus californicus TaxID=6832 RepID=A0A553PQV8_TIGCA|nr:trichohyalin-like [Tigriopus californicus]TRY80064.1 hypothetical protein TCAL_06003 [Tigriopus californicus]